MKIVLDGACHCGAFTIQFTISLPVPELPVRRCMCRFCRTHGARTASDRNGSALLRGPKEQLRDYRFATRSAAYMLCACCGSYIGAMIQEPGSAFATLNVNLIDEPHLNQHVGTPVTYRSEPEALRTARRRRLWTPFRLSLA